MTTIRIDPDEMAVVSSTLQGVAGTVGAIGPGLTARAAGCALSPGAATEVTAVLSRAQADLHDVQLELLLHGTLVAARGLLAAQGQTAVANATGAELEAMRTAAPVAGPDPDPVTGVMTGTGPVTAFSTIMSRPPRGSTGGWGNGAKSDPIIAALQNGEAYRKLYGQSAIAHSNAEHEWGADLDLSGGIGDLQLGSGDH